MQIFIQFSNEICVFSNKLKIAIDKDRNRNILWTHKLFMQKLKNLEKNSK